MASSRNRVIYAGNTILMSDSPSWENQTGISSLKCLKRIQSSSVEVSTPVARAKQIGSSAFTFQKYLDYPKISTSFTYYLSDNSNEAIMGFITNGVTGCFKEFSSFGKDTNIFYLLSNNDSEDFSNVDNADSFMNYNVFGMGNCFLKTFSINAAVGSIPTASAGYDCLNIVFQNYTGTGTSLPSVNLTGGSISTGTYLLTGFNLNTENYISNQSNKPSALRPGDIVLQMEQPLIGGVRYSGNLKASITSLNIEIPLERKDLVGFGSNYPFDKRLIFPIVGNLSFEGIFDEAVTGNFYKIFDDENDYSFNFIFNDSAGIPNYKVGISNARVENQNFDLSIGENMNFSSSFSFEISETDGFTISGSSTLLDSVVVDYADAVGISDDATRIAINNFVGSLKDNNIWDKFSGIYPLLGDGSTTQAINLISPQDSDASYRLKFLGNGTVFSNNSGVRFLGSNDYADTCFNPYNLPANDIHFSVLSLVNAANLNAAPDLGCRNQFITSQFELYLRDSAADVSSFTAYQFTNSQIDIPSVTNSKAFYVATKENTNTGHLLLFTNSSNPVYSAKDTTMTDNNKPNLNIYIGALNNNGVASFASSSNRSFGFISFGRGLTSGESVILYTAVKKLQTDLNRNLDVFV